MKEYLLELYRLDIQKKKEFQTIHPWVTFLHLFIGEDKKAYHCVKFANQQITEQKISLIKNVPMYSTSPGWKIVISNLEESPEDLEEVAMLEFRDQLKEELFELFKKVDPKHPLKMEDVEIIGMLD